MNIFCFEESINSTILERGYRYYLDGYVSDEFVYSNEIYEFLVKETSDYKVIVKLDNENNILESECNCPYDYGPICKHEVAVFYKLREIFSNKKTNDHKSIKNNVQTIPQILQSLEKNQLIEIIMDEMDNNSGLRGKILIKYAPVLDYEEELKKCKKYIYSRYRECIKSNNYGYNNYYDMQDKLCQFENEMYEVLNRAVKVSNQFLGIEMAFLVLGQSLEILINDYEIYDEDFLIEELINYTLSIIKNIVTNVKDLDIRKQLLHKLMEKCDGLDLNEWYAYQVDIIRICFNIADNFQDKEILRKRIEQMITLEPEEYHNKYEIITLKKYLYEFIVQYWDKSKVKDFINENIEYSDFREIAIQNCLKNGEFEQAIKYAKEGEENSIHNIKWKEYRYQAYKELGLIEEQKLLAKELLFDGEIFYYNELKSLNNDKNFYENFKKEIKTLKELKTMTYLQIIEEENDLDAIMEYVREHNWSIEKYAKKLLPKYKDEVKDIYEIYLRYIANKSSNRKEYKHLCEKIKKVKKLLGKKSVDNLIQDFKITYKRRRAMIEELNKI